MIRNHRIARLLAVSAGAALALGCTAGIAAAEDVGSQNSGGLTYLTPVSPVVPPVITYNPCTKKPWLCVPPVTVPPMTVPPVTTPTTVSTPTTEAPPTTSVTPTTTNATAGSSGVGLVDMPEAPHVVVQASPTFTG